MMNRFEKLDWLKETCNEAFMNDDFVNELVMWLGEDEFDAFYEHICRNWDIAPTPEELNERMGI